MDLDWKCNLETYTLLMGKSIADYQGSYKPEVNRARVNTYGTTVLQLSITLCTIWDCVSSCRLQMLVLLGLAVETFTSRWTQYLSACLLMEMVYLLLWYHCIKLDLKVMYQTRKTAVDHISRHWEKNWKYNV